MTTVRRDEATLDLLKAKDARGLERLLEDHGPRARWLLVRAFGGFLGALELEEVMNIAAYNVWRAIDTYDPGRGTLRAWYYRVVHNSALGVLRGKRRVRETTQNLDHLTAPDQAAPAEGSASDLVLALRHAVDQLPPMQQEIIRADLRSDHTVSAADLAQSLGSTRNSVYVSRNKARSALKKALVSEGYDL